MFGKTNLPNLYYNPTIWASQLQVGQAGRDKDGVPFLRISPYVLLNIENGKVNVWSSCLVGDSFNTSITLLPAGTEFQITSN